MTVQVTDNTLKETILTAINTALGTGSIISWRDNGAIGQLASSTLNAGGNPFTVSGASMTLTGTPITSSDFGGTGLITASFRTSGGVEKVRMSVTTTGGGGDIQFASLPQVGEAIRITSMSMSVV